jgi:5-methylcytosine-specific restriction enzyme subunit McrC
MIRRSVREWEYLAIEPAGPNAFDRPAADRILAVARKASLGGEDGVRILTDHHVKVRAQQVVGVIAARGVIVEILPKIDGAESDSSVRRRLIQMLSVALDLEIADGALTELGTQNENLLEVLIRLFCDLLFAALHRGLPRRYVGHEDDLPALRGRLDVQRQFTVRAASPQLLACRYDDLSPDIALNQIMKAAVSRLAAHSRLDENRRRLAELALAFADVRALPVKSLPWGDVQIDRTNRSWEQLFALARLLLREQFQTTTAGDATGFALLFEMNTLFEEFVGRMLRRQLAPGGFAVRLQGPHNHALLEEVSGTPRFRTIPDILVTRNGTRAVVIDTKWKRLKGRVDDAKDGVGQPDVYQMMAYAHVYHCERLMLLYPYHDGLGGAAGVLRTYKVNGTVDTRVIIATVSLAEPKSLGASLRELLVSEDLIDDLPSVAAM